jgi:hypothetical protein
VCLLRCLTLRSRSAIRFEQLLCVADELLSAAFWYAELSLEILF